MQSFVHHLLFISMFTCSLRMMCLDDVYCELPTNTPGSPSSCSPVCRTLPVIKNEMSRWASRQESPCTFLGLLPSSKLGSWPSAGWCSVESPAVRHVDEETRLPLRHWPDPPPPTWGRNFTFLFDANSSQLIRTDRPLLQRNDGLHELSMNVLLVFPDAFRFVHFSFSCEPFLRSKLRGKKLTLTQRAGKLLTFES